MPDKIIKLFACLLIACSQPLTAQPVQKWQDRNGEWHFGDPRAAPPRGSRDVTIQRPISVVKNERPLPRYVPNGNTGSARQHNGSRRAEPTSSKPSKADCENMRDALRLSPTLNYHQRQQDYERECIIGVRYADSQQ